jgi:hypothetical protein
MGLVASFATRPTVVFTSGYLFEPGGLGPVGLMTTPAQGDNLRFYRFGFLRIASVQGCWPVTGLASYAAMFSGCLGGQLIGMAVRARSLAGEADRFLLDLA